MSKLSAREEHIIDRVRRERERLGISQSEMAEKLGLSKAGYGHYDRGRQPFSVDQLFHLSRILGRSVEWLLGLESDLTPREDQLLSLFRSATPEKQGEILAVIQALLKGLT